MRLIDADKLYPDRMTTKGGVAISQSQIADAPTVNPDKRKWIPCSERMPEEPYGCLVTIDDEEPITGQIFEGILPYFVGWDGERWNDSDGEQCPFEVIAWMPLPKPYEAESEE